MTAGGADGSTFARVKLTLMLGGLAAFMALSSDMYVPAFPELTRDFRSSPSQLQLTLTAFLIGAALGHLFWGPLTDVVGRRRPLLIGTACYSAASIACAFAPDVHVFIGLRFAQGLAAAAGAVIARAIVRDLYTGAAGARFFSRLMLVTGAAPMLAPSIAGQMLAVTSWRAIFVVLAVVGVVLLCAASLGLHETLPRERRRSEGFGAMRRSIRGLIRDKSFVAYTLTESASVGAMFAYIAASAFVLQGAYGLSPQTYGLVFGVNAAGVVTLAQVNAHLIKRGAHPRALLHLGRALGLAGGLLLFVAVLWDGTGLWGILLAFFLVVSSMGFTGPNATALALADHADAAGAGSALIGVTAMCIGAALAPITGIGGSENATSLALAVLALEVFAFFTLTVLARGQPHRMPSPAEVVELTRIDA